MTDLDKLLKDNLSKETYDKAVIINKDKHTVGAWEVRGSIDSHNTCGDYNIVQVEGAGYYIANTIGGLKNDDMEEANAHLIAASPELLEALEGLFNSLVDEDGNCMKGVDEEMVLNAAWAIKKSRGES